ncbi:hypothetical protein Q3G72_026375 [Acer saccharum]|nr:hypothetical protein Q3G72_026375 [Acer saccharum]
MLDEIAYKNNGISIILETENYSQVLSNEESSWDKLSNEESSENYSNVLSHDDPVFNPATSASYTVVPCGSPTCDALLFNDRRCHAGKCGYELTESDYGGVNIDTGTMVVALPMVAYEALWDVFIAKASGVRAPSVLIFDTYYHQYSDNFQFPSISFYLLGGPILTLESHGFLIPVDGVETVCFAFAPSAVGLSIIRNVQQAGIQISIDEARGYVGVIASYTVVLCGSPAYDALLLNDCRCHAGKCGYEVNYADGSYTKGTLMLETLTFGQMRIQNMAMGCGHNNQGSFNVIAGMLGLGGGRMSFVNQIPETGGAFSYCLPSYSILSPGWLRFGRGLGVEGARVPISEDIFRLTESGYGGVIIDTGTMVTTLSMVAYEALRDAFIAKTNGVKAPSVLIFDTCYHQYNDNFQFPSISFYFLDGPILTLESHGFLILVDGVETVCFAFAPSAVGLSIIINVQQAGIQISSRIQIFI